MPLLNTTDVMIGTSIMLIYTRNVADFAQTALYTKFLKVDFVSALASVMPALNRMGITAGKPLSDMRQFVEDMKAVPRVGDLPPIVLATLRDKMIQLAQEIGGGMVFANRARSHMRYAGQPQCRNQGEYEFFIGTMIPTRISDDKDAAAAVNRNADQLCLLPNYRNYWKEAGYEEEMNGVEAAIAEKDYDRARMSIRPLASGYPIWTATQVREGIEAWFDAGIKRQSSFHQRSQEDRCKPWMSSSRSGLSEKSNTLADSSRKGSDPVLAQQTSTERLRRGTCRCR